MGTSIGINHRLKDDFLLGEIGVSRETCEKLHCYYGLLLEWNKKINLVSRKSIYSSWPRHFLDSAQLWRFAQKHTQRWLDFGSGAGFPGLVIGVVAQELKPKTEVILVEKNKKKVLFLKDVAQKLSLNVTILWGKVEEIEPLKADVISSRAFGPLRLLIEISYMHKNSRTISIFPKGKSFEREIQDSLKQWKFDVNKVDNILEKNSSILEIRNIEVGP